MGRHARTHGLVTPQRYRVRHRTTYRYSSVVTGSYGRGFLVPRDTGQQRCLTHRMHVDPAPADESRSRDAHGNLSTYFHITAPHTQLTVATDSVVEVRPAAGDGVAEQPWEAARPAGPRHALHTEFVLDLQPPEITDAVRDYAAPTFTPGRPLHDAVTELTRRIHRDFRYRSGTTTVSTRVAEVLAARAGVCQDFARLAIACLRAQGLAASYVSGYLVTEPPPGAPRLVGADASHAWAAVWSPAGHWLAFDPTNDQFVDHRYIVLGWGRDYADIPPLRGVIYTESQHSAIDVAVDVTPYEGDLPDA